MDVIAAIHGRRSVRSFQPKPVERDTIESLIWDAAQAPPPSRGQDSLGFQCRRGHPANRGVWCTRHGLRQKPSSRRTGLELARKTWLQDLLGCCANHHFRTSRGLLPRRSEPDALRTRTRTGNLLGRFAHALAEHRRSESRVGDTCSIGTGCGIVPRLSLGGVRSSGQRTTFHYLDLRNHCAAEVIE